MAIVKVVILNWNGVAHLNRFLPSVVANTPQDVEIVVADNGSTDSSCDFLGANFPTVSLVKLDRNYGFAEGYNRALSMIEADYFVLLNSDVEVTKGWCNSLIDIMESDTNVAAIAPKLLSYADRSLFEYAGACGGFIDALGYPFCRGRILSCVEHDQGQYDSAREVFWASGACMMFRATIYRELGGFDNMFFAHMEEIDLCWRAQLAGYKIMIEPRSYVYHLGGGTLPNNTPKKLYLNYRNNLAMLYKNLSGSSVGLVLFVRMLLDGASALVYLLQGRNDFFKAVFKAHCDFYKWKPALIVQRREIQQRAVTRSKQIYRGSIVLRYIFGYKKFSDVV